MSTTDDTPGDLTEKIQADIDKLEKMYTDT
jgi:hypothetical protein